ncbi:YELLOW STRIPE like 6 [Actinidia rufa]|uniref:YELLOW STRIPE like 6 n=1 Tax=Actinidia rufa TaxID=165716 RepID=A0A7J0DG57_9ERIC|nr:YELLOW STRIPE like 6 [Actinidia rufa]
MGTENNANVEISEPLLVESEKIRDVEIERIPEWKEQITIRGLVVSAVMGGLFCIITHKLNLTVGIIPSLNVAAGLLGFFFVKSWTGLLSKLGFSVQPFTRQENTVIQTCVVACYGLAFSVLLGAIISWGVLWPYISQHAGDWYPADLGSNDFKGLYGYKLISLSVMTQELHGRFCEVARALVIRELCNSSAKQKNLPISNEASAMGCVIAPLTFWLFWTAFDVGSPDGPYKAPYAVIFREMAILGVEGFAELPKHCLALCCGFFVAALVVNLLRDVTPTRISQFIPIPMAMAVPFYIGAYFAIDMFVGTVILYIWERINRKDAEDYAGAVASGLICGDGIWTIPSAILSIFRINPPICMYFGPSASS